MLSLKMRKARKGLTMIEMMGVAVLLTIFAAMIGTAIFNSVNQGKVSAAQAQIRQMGQAMELYTALEGRGFPVSQTDVNQTTRPEWFNVLVTGGYLNDTRDNGHLDPWGQPYLYCQPNPTSGTDGAIWSVGPNGNGNYDCSSGTASGSTLNNDLYYVFRIVN